MFKRQIIRFTGILTEYDSSINTYGEASGKIGGGFITLTDRRVKYISNITYRTFVISVDKFTPKGCSRPMKLTQFATLIIFVVLMIAGCSATENQPLTSIQQSNESPTTVGVQEQQNGLKTLVAGTSSCEKPPITMEWAGKKYILKDENSSAEPGMKFGYVSCEKGQFNLGDGGPGTLVVYSNGDPRTNHDLIFVGKWGYALYNMTQSLKVEDIASLQVVGGLPGTKGSPLYQSTNETGKTIITKIVSWINSSKPIGVQKEHGKHGYPMVIKLKMNDGKFMYVETGYTCVSKTNADGSGSKSCTTLKGEIVLSNDSTKIRAESPELYEWLNAGWKNEK